MLFLVFCSEV